MIYLVCTEIDNEKMLCGVYDSLALANADISWKFKRDFPHLTFTIETTEVAHDS